MERFVLIVHRVQPWENMAISTNEQVLISGPILPVNGTSVFVQVGVDYAVRLDCNSSRKTEKTSEKPQESEASDSKM